MSPAADVLANYPAPLRGPLTPLGNHGGFSGAELFRVETPGGALCLRAWPAAMRAMWLDQIHAWMRQAALHVDFVPHVLPTARGESYVKAAGRLWELTTWMPGAPEPPTAQRVQAACIVLARVHRAWAEPQQPLAALQSIERRLAVARDWLPLLAAGWQPPADPLDPVAPWAARAVALLRQHLPEIPDELAPWRSQPLPVQPCLCDVWSAHVLFTGDRVTGLVDFGSCKIDHVAVGLARLLGSMAGDDAALWTAGLDAYAQQRPLTTEERALARDLDRTGVVVAAANWLRWLYRDGRVYPDRAAVAQRLAALVARLAA